MFAKLLITVAIFAGSVVPARAQQSGVLNAARVQWAAGWLNHFAPEGVWRTGVPGMTIAVVYKDQVVYLQGFGVRKAGEGAPVDPDTVFPVAGLSEPIATTALASLVAQGNFDWDIPISSLDPNFHLSDPYVTGQVTLRDLMSHRSGLPVHPGDLLQDLGYAQAGILQRLQDLQLGGFRLQFAEAEFGATEAANATALEYGDTWERLMQAQLFRPLGMNSTSTLYANYVNAANRAALHVPVNGQMTPAYEFNDDPAAPASGVSSTARDLANWLLLHLNQGNWNGQPFIDSSQLAQTYVPQVLPDTDATGRPQFYALGWNVEYLDSGKRKL